MTAGADLLATPVPGSGYVLLGPRGVALLSRALAVAEHMARRDGIGVNADVVRLRAVLGAAAPGGIPEVPPPAVLPASDGFSVIWGARLGTAEAARLLGCTDRNVRDLCVRGVFRSAALRHSRWTVGRDEVVSRATTGQVRDTTSAA